MLISLFQENNPEDCQVCLTSFDNTVQRPRTLPCGHTFCSPCMNELMEQRQITCPTCHVRHSIPGKGHFPINYNLEAFIRRLRDTEETYVSRPSRVGKILEVAGKPSRKRAPGLSNKMRSLLQEQEAKVIAAASVCQEIQSQLDHYQTTLSAWDNQQDQLEKRFQAVMDQIRNVRKLMRQEESQVAAKKDQMQLAKLQLETQLETLRKITTEQEAAIAIVDVVRCTDETEKKVEESQRMFPNFNTVITARKVSITL